MSSRSTPRALSGLTVALVLVLIAAAAPAQHVRRGSVAEIRAEQLEYDWDSGVTEMSGNCRVTIAGAYDATMTAPSILVKTDIEKAQVLSFEARGPVTFDILTAEKDGKRSRIKAGCSDSATFSEQTMLAVLRGNAHAEITGIAQTESLQSAVYDGASMTIDLKNRKIKLAEAHLQVEMAPEPEKPAAGGTP